MKIKNIKICNYRNLNGLEVHLHDTINFIVGENNLGKSNFLNLLNILFTKRAFEKDDFFDKDNPIEIEFTLKLDECEIGNFDDLIDADNPVNEITIKAIQDNFEENLKFEHLGSGESIHPNKIRAINYVHYDSLRNPITEISFDKMRGAGTFLNHLIKKKMENKSLNDADLIKSDNQDFQDLLSEVNTTLKKIKSFKDHSISAKLETEIANLLTKLVLLKDSTDRGLDKIGYGVQFSMLIALSILEKLVSISQNKNFQSFDYSIESSNKKAISLLLGLDEPEIHLHPYMQRALVKYLFNIIENRDADFSEILKEAFDFDKVIGQVIIVTHSPNILFNDFRHVIRFYNKAQKLTIKSNINLQEQAKKHFLMQFQYIKEAFFSKCVILVEGEGELGSFPLFAKNMGYDFDDLGISVIKAGAVDSVSPLLELLEKFGIPCIGIIDNDLDRQNKYNDINNLFKTLKQDFEAEIITSGTRIK